MRSALSVLIIFMLAAGFAIAENKQKPTKLSEGVKRGRVERLKGGLFTRMFVNMLYRTKTLDLNNKQKGEISNVGKEYARSIMNEENRSRVLQRKFMKELESNEFDSPELKIIANEIQKTNLKATDTFIDGVEELKRIMGSTNFAKLTPITKVDRNALVQLREGNVNDPTELQETGSKEPEAKADNK